VGPQVDAEVPAEPVGVDDYCSPSVVEVRGRPRPSLETTTWRRSR
jgi:hypothetical protein